MKSACAILPCLAICALLAASCAGTAQFEYAAAPGAITAYSPLPGADAITVLPFLDQRSLRVLQPADTPAPPAPPRDGSFALGWIPFLPCAWVNIATPEAENAGQLATLNRYWCQFPRELALAATDSLRQSRLFPEVRYADSIDQATTPWLFQGVITNTDYRGERITYGLTYLIAPALWLVGFPDAVSHNRLDLTFHILDRSTRKPIWTFHYHGTDYLVHWLYARVGDDASLYPRLMKLAMSAVAYDLNLKPPVFFGNL